MTSKLFRKVLFVMCAVLTYSHSMLYSQSKDSIYSMAASALPIAALVAQLIVRGQTVSIGSTDVFMSDIVTVGTISAVAGIKGNYSSIPEQLTSWFVPTMVSRWCSGYIMNPSSTSSFWWQPLKLATLLTAHAFAQYVTQQTLVKIKAYLSNKSSNTSAV
ncbi:hypothetical protein J120_01430 [candidate division TM6 bacterium JCVI TM6SC1]|uniref:Uncharacterized protein n=1 Tax=candidate division TM6 bacterium JCVI TM6SC1 TaxID=1306947 RepID=A0A0D2I355_9BACT|nr:hypothetical protein J120_01430 [candidate division TM6 bacterium JCVI TM6SC1]